MGYEEFVNKVRERAGLGSYEEAERATRAAIGMVGKQLTGEGGRLDVASELPDELAEHLNFQAPKGETISTYDDLLKRLGQSEGVRTEEAEAHARAVMAVLGDVVGEGDMEKIRREFPEDAAPLFTDATG